MTGHPRMHKRLLNILFRGVVNSDWSNWNDAMCIMRSFVREEDYMVQEIGRCGKCENLHWSESNQVDDYHCGKTKRLLMGGGTESDYWRCLEESNQVCIEAEPSPNLIEYDQPDDCPLEPITPPETKTEPFKRKRPKGIRQ